MLLHGSSQTQLSSVEMIVETDSEFRVLYPMGAPIYTANDTSITANSLVVQEKAGLQLFQDGKLTLNSTTVKIAGNLTNNGRLDVNTSSVTTFETEATSLVEFIPARSDILENVTTIRFGGKVTLNGAIDISGCHTFNIGNGGTFEINVEDITLTPSFKLYCHTISIGGEFHPEQQVNFDVGSTVFEVTSQGNFVFNPASDFKADTVYINGKFQSNDTLNMAGKSISGMRDLEMNSTGIFILDANNQESLQFTNISYISVHNARLDGKVSLGKINSDIKAATGSNGEGWDILQVNADGTVGFESSGTFEVDDIIVSGNLTVYNPIAIESHTAGRNLDVLLKGTGYMRLDSLATHPCGTINNFTGQSVIKYKSFKTESGSKFYGGQLYFEGQNFNNSGEFYFEAVNDTLKVDVVEIGGKLEACRPIEWTGLTSSQISQLAISGTVKLDSTGDHTLTKCSWSESGHTVFNLVQLTLSNNGKLYAGKTSIAGTLRVLLLEHSNTVFEYDPAGDFNIQETYISGRMTSCSPMSTYKYKGKK